MGERIGLRRRKGEGNGFMEDPRIGKRMKRGGRSSGCNQRSKLSGCKARGFSSKPYVCNAVDGDCMRFFDSPCRESVGKMDADFADYLDFLGISRRGKMVDEELEASKSFTNGGKTSTKKKKCRRSDKSKDNARRNSSWDGHGNGVEDDTRSDSFDDHYEMFLEHVTEKGGSYFLKILMGDGKWSSVSYEGLDCCTSKGYGKREGRKGNGELNCKKRGRGGACIRSEFHMNKKKSPVVGRKTVNKTIDELSCGKTLRKNRGFGLKTCGADSSLGDENVAGESFDYDTPSADNVTVAEPHDGEYEMFLEHLTSHKTSYMLNATTGDGKSISFLYEAEDCGTREGFAKGEGRECNNDLQPKKRRRDEVCIWSKHSVSRQKTDVVGRETSNTIKNDSSCGMVLKNSQSNLSTSGANLSLGFRASDANDVSLDESLDGEYKMFLEHLTVHGTSYMLDVTMGDGKKTSFLYEAADMDLQCKERSNSGICIRSKFSVNRESPMVKREETTNKTKDGSSGGMENSLIIIESTRRPTTEPKIAVNTVNEVMLLELPKADDALRTEQERGLVVYGDLSQQEMETEKGRNDNERCEAMYRPISCKLSVNKGHGSKDLDSTKQWYEEEVGGCFDQVDKCLNPQMENWILSEKAIKQEEVDPTSSSDSDDDLIEVDPDTFYHGDNTPFSTTDCRELVVVQYDDDEEEEGPVATNTHSEFRLKLMEILRQPYNDEEYDELLAEVCRPRKKQPDDEMPRSWQAKRSPGMSYLDQHKDFAKKIAEVEIDPDLEHRRPRVLNLLRGFVYFLQNLPVDGAFKPWKDKLCLEVLPCHH